MNWSIGKKILAGYLLSLALLLVLGTAAILSVRSYKESARLEDHTRDILDLVDRIELDLLNAQTAQRGFLLSGQESYLRPYTEAVATLPEAIAELASLTAGNTAQRDRVARLRQFATAKLSAIERTLQLRRGPDATAATAAFAEDRDDILMSDIREITDDIRADQLTLLERVSGAAATRAQRLERFILIVVPLAALLLVLVGFAVSRNIARPLREITRAAEQIAAGDPDITLPPGQRGDEVGQLSRSFARMGAVLSEVAAINARIAEGDLTTTIVPQSASDKFASAHHDMIVKLSRLVGGVQRAGLQVNTSATEIAATSKQQQATATEIAATTTEIGATSREIAATSRELVRTVGEVSQVAEETASLAGAGHTSLGRMEDTMRHIVDASAAISGKLAVLNEKATNINAVITTITKVADQTNLLSLNAAIEAEKAGEYGLGFAVVATEIRRLADQTAVATGDIERMVNEMQSSVSAGVMGMDKFSDEVRRGVDEVRQVGAQLGQIIQQVQAFTPRFESVNEGMQSQSAGAQQITDSLSQLSEAAQQTAESLRNSSLAIEQLNDAARELQTGVARFKLKSP